MSYKFYLGDILFPVSPSKITWKYGNQNKTTTLINYSEINIIKPMGLTEFTFDALLPNVKYPFAVYEQNLFQDAGIFIEKIRNLKVSQKPFYFKVIRTMPTGRVLFLNEDFKAVLEDYSVKEDAKEGFDVTVSVKLKQYVDYKTEIISIDNKGNATVEEERPADNIEKPSSDNPMEYTVQKGESLWGICRKKYNDGSKCWEIAKLNNITNPNLIYPGQVIRLE